MATTVTGAEIKRRRNLLKWSRARLSKEAGFPTESTYVRDIENGKSRNPAAAGLTQIANAFGCKVNDLVEPKSELPRPHPADSVLLYNKEKRAPHWTTTPVREVSAYTGIGGGGLEDEIEELGTWQLPTEWLRSEIRGTNLGDLRILTLEGDSMEGTLAPGDKVIVDLSRRTPSPPGLFVIFDGLAQVAKRLVYAEGSEPPAVDIISDNIHYAAYRRTLDEVHIVGRIMGRWQRLS